VNDRAVLADLHNEGAVTRTCKELGRGAGAGRLDLRVPASIDAQGHDIAFSKKNCTLSLLSYCR
jgi:hypothetical protein